MGSTIEEKWHQIRGRVQERWHDITDDELNKIRDRSEQLVDLLQEKYDYSQERAEEELARLAEYGDRFQNKAGETAAYVDRVVADNRWEVVVAAFGAGILLGLWLGSERR